MKIEDKTLELDNLYVSFVIQDGRATFGMSQPVAAQDHPGLEFIMLDKAHAEALRDYLVSVLK